MKKILIAYGTRPEAIKIASLALHLKKSKQCEVILLNTGQHLEMVEQVESIFNFSPDYSLKVMKHNQNLNHVLSKVIEGAQEVLQKEQPDIVLVQGDTTTVMAVGICCFHLQIPVGHIEAGLRSFDMRNPYPEEFNRRTISLLAQYHFAPTQKAVQNLLDEGIDKQKIHLVGNTVVDATRLMSEMYPYTIERAIKTKRILVTVHRRENHGEGLKLICQAIKQMVTTDANIEFIWPLHPNPNVKDIVNELLSTEKAVKLLNPLNYQDLIQEMQSAYLIWTDSGGIQEEAPFFKKPVLILREVTERPEVVESGFGFLVGTDPSTILQYTQSLLLDPNKYYQAISGRNPFGDGYSAKRITDILCKS